MMFVYEGSQSLTVFSHAIMLTRLGIGRKFNVDKTFRGRPGLLLNVLCTINLRPVSRGKWVKKSFVNHTSKYFKRSSYYLPMKFYSNRKRHLVEAFPGYHGALQHEVPIAVLYSETTFFFFCFQYVFTQIKSFAVPKKLLERVHAWIFHYRTKIIFSIKGDSDLKTSFFNFFVGYTA